MIWEGERASAVLTSAVAGAETGSSVHGVEFWSVRPKGWWPGLALSSCVVLKPPRTLPLGNEAWGRTRDGRRDLARESATSPPQTRCGTSEKILV